MAVGLADARVCARIVAFKLRAWNIKWMPGSIGEFVSEEELKLDRVLARITEDLQAYARDLWAASDTDGCDWVCEVALEATRNGWSFLRLLETTACIGGPRHTHRPFLLASMSARQADQEFRNYMQAAGPYETACIYYISDMLLVHFYAVRPFVHAQERANIRANRMRP